MDKEIDFTIVTPSYNYAHYIEECLESVRIQKGVAVEHLVMDGMSTDNTEEVVAKFPHARFFQEPDEGMSDAINKGFLKAKGRWVMWLNADDKLRAGALRAILNHEKENPGADVLFGAFNFMNGDGKFIRRMPLFPFGVLMNSHYGPSVASTSCFLKREAVIEAGHLVDVNFRYVMDGEYYSRLGRAGIKFVYVPRVLADFRWHGLNLSRRNYLDESSMEAILGKQKQYAESHAIRRAYGLTLVNDLNLCGIIDGVLALYFRGLRGVLKLIYGAQTKDCAEGEGKE